MDSEEYREVAFLPAERALRYLKHLTLAFSHVQKKKKEKFRQNFIGKLNELSESKTIDEEIEVSNLSRIEGEINQNFDIQQRIIKELEAQERTIEEVAKGEKSDSLNINELKERQKEMLIILKKLDQNSSVLVKEAKTIRPTKDFLLEKKKRMQEVEAKIKTSTEKSPKQIEIEKQIQILEAKYNEFEASGKFSEEQLKRVKNKIDMLKLKSV